MMEVVCEALHSLVSLVKAFKSFVISTIEDSRRNLPMRIVVSVWYDIDKQGIHWHET